MYYKTRILYVHFHRRRSGVEVRFRRWVWQYRPKMIALKPVNPATGVLSFVYRPVLDFRLTAESRILNRASTSLEPILAQHLLTKVHWVGFGFDAVLPFHGLGSALHIEAFHRLLPLHRNSFKLFPNKIKGPFLNYL